MKDLRGTYVHRGDVLRRRRRVRATVMVVGLFAAAVLAARSWEPLEAAAAGAISSGELAGLGVVKPSGLKGEQLERLNSIYNYSRRYKITTEMATSVYDAAVAEKI